MPNVYETHEFEQETKKLDKKYQKQIEKLKDQLAVKIHIGKILRYPFLREKKIQDKRIYFLIYENLNSVLLVAISSKKTQQETIDKIAELLPEFKKLIEKIT